MTRQETHKIETKKLEKKEYLKIKKRESRQRMSDSERKIQRNNVGGLQALVRKSIEKKRMAQSANVSDGVSDNLIDSQKIVQNMSAISEKLKLKRDKRSLLIRRLIAQFATGVDPSDSTEEPEGTEESVQSETTEQGVETLEPGLETEVTEVQTVEDSRRQCSVPSAVSTNHRRDSGKH